VISYSSDMTHQRDESTGAEPVRQSQSRLDTILSIVVCPTCHGDLMRQAMQLYCPACNARYPVHDDRIYFIEPMPQTDKLDSVKNRLKRAFGKAYYSVGVNLFAPTYPFNYPREVARWRSQECSVIVDIGCGNNRVDDAVITLDGVDYDAVDIVADVTALPFRSGSVDGFASRSVLEHIPNVHSAIAEMKRCTRPGGVSLHLVPFLFPYHASPHDYQRYTHTGAARLFADWNVIEQRNATGPVTLFLLCLIEFLSTLFSFGRDELKSLQYLLFCGLLFPIKYLDAPFVGRKKYLGLAPTIFTVFRKPEA